MAIYCCNRNGNTPFLAYGLNVWAAARALIFGIGRSLVIVIVHAKPKQICLYSKYSTWLLRAVAYHHQYTKYKIAFMHRNTNDCTCTSCSTYTWFKHRCNVRRFCIVTHIWQNLIKHKTLLMFYLVFKWTFPLHKFIIALIRPYTSVFKEQLMHN